MKLLPIGVALVVLVMLGLIGAARWLSASAPAEDGGGGLVFDGGGASPAVSSSPTTPLVRAVPEIPAAPQRDAPFAVPPLSTTPLVRAVPEAPADPQPDDPLRLRESGAVNYAEKGVQPAL